MPNHKWSIGTNVILNVDADFIHGIITDVREATDRRDCLIYMVKFCNNELIVFSHEEIADMNQRFRELT